MSGPGRHSTDAPLAVSLLTAIRINQGAFSTDPGQGLGTLSTKL